MTDSQSETIWNKIVPALILAAVCAVAGWVWTLGERVGELESNERVNQVRTEVLNDLPERLVRIESSQDRTESEIRRLRQAIVDQESARRAER